MVALLLGDRSDLVREGERLREVGEAKLPLEVVLVDDAPLRAELACERGQLLPFHRRDAAAARDAFLIGER